MKGCYIYTYIDLGLIAKLYEVESIALSWMTILSIRVRMQLWQYGDNGS